MPAKYDMSNFREMPPDEQAIIVADIRGMEADLRISVAEHVMGFLDGNPAAGDPDSFRYNHTPSDLSWDSPSLFLNDRNVKQEHPRLAETVRIVTWLREEVMRAAGEGEPLRDAETQRQIIGNILPRCWSKATLNVAAIGEPFSERDLLAAEDAYTVRDPLPDSPTIRALQLGAKMVTDAYLQGHGGLQQTPLD